jgi:hypothetical protein
MNMSGRGVRYEQLPLFFGCVPRLGVRAAWIGACDGAGETHGFWWRNAPQGGTSNGNGSSNGRAPPQRRQTSMRGDAMAAASGGGDDGGAGGWGGRVKGAFSSLFGKPTALHVCPSDQHHNL